MANNKTGFNYYNTDTDRYQDIKIKRLKKDFGCAGIAVYDYVLCEIYRVKGCFIEWGESTAFDVAEYFGIKESLVNEIVNYCGVVGLFEKELLARGSVITSLSIQKRYIEMCNRAKRTSILIPEKIKLTEQSNILTEELDIIQEESTVSSVGLPQSKVKESKVKESKEKESMADKPPTHPHEVIEKFNAFKKWIDNNASRVNQMKQPITIEEYLKLKDKMPKDVITKLLMAMHNYKPLLQKSVSAYLTILNWYKREEDSSTTTNDNKQSNVNAALKSAGKAQ